MQTCGLPERAICSHLAPARTLTSAGNRRMPCSTRFVTKRQKLKTRDFTNNLMGVLAKANMLALVSRIQRSSYYSHLTLKFPPPPPPFLVHLTKLIQDWRRWEMAVGDVQSTHALVRITHSSITCGKTRVVPISPQGCQDAQSQVLFCVCFFPFSCIG